ncbi:hypothetical protein M422DRAFT_49169 [Sphaerobolus stellatus SS14]|uniref:Uncharacterized protein n=1 Tax=Sphaerobolus stellatus (strain SS14) TaxID=990650 RepID=A0A0C9VQI5_SPHS4|nr:hypothetical protein M422DRAFT_49169 [Sphaerobolus stellatus SS14]
MHLFSFRNRRQQGQCDGTRSNRLKKSNQTCIKQHAKLYHRHRAAMLAIDPQGQDNDKWTKTYQDLKDNGLKPLKTGWMDGDTRDSDPDSEEELLVETESEGHRTISWIWRVGHVLAVDEVDNTGYAEAL